MKPHPSSPPLILLSLSVVFLLGLLPVASALAVLPPTALHDQNSLQAINYDGNDSQDVRRAVGINTLPDEPIAAAPTVIEHTEIPVGVSPPSTSAPSTGCTTSKLTKSIPKIWTSTVTAAKNFPSTLYNFIKASHPERHPRFAGRAAGAKRDLNQEDPKFAVFWLIDMEEWAERHFASCYTGGSSQSKKRDLMKHGHEEDGHGHVVHVKRDVKEVNQAYYPGYNKDQGNHRLGTREAEMNPVVKEIRETILSILQPLLKGWNR
ncbi:hypothetical protein N0V85_006762 [Neurospora sp. IMI 360204]|nr:hypothetical protein N0V85_006762 [Neurospora sp. IMI 360204]